MAYLGKKSQINHDHTPISFCKYTCTNISISAFLIKTCRCFCKVILISETAIPPPLPSHEVLHMNKDLVAVSTL